MISKNGGQSFEDQRLLSVGGVGLFKAVKTAISPINCAPDINSKAYQK
jgi:hypothetical protein